VLAAACARDGEGANAPVRVAAAADLALAFGELGESFTRDTGQSVVFSFGSTGLLAKQLEEGAPFDLFAAANVSFVDRVVAAGACDGATQAPYARGRIAIWSRGDKSAPPTRLEDLADLPDLTDLADLADQPDRRFRHIAIANPEHTPYGQAAKEAMRTAGVWDRIAPRLVFGENVRQTLQFAETGNADVAIVALSLVILDTKNPWTLIPEALHPPIDQALVVCDRGGNRNGGLAFARYVNSESGRRVMRRYGFLLPGESVPQ
jgi:molybdate transport system substrate-binding protein